MIDRTREMFSFHRLFVRSFFIYNNLLLDSGGFHIPHTKSIDPRPQFEYHQVSEARAIKLDSWPFIYVLEPEPLDSIVGFWLQPRQDGWSQAY